MVKVFPVKILKLPVKITSAIYCFISVPMHKILSPDRQGGMALFRLQTFNRVAKRSLYSLETDRKQGNKYGYQSRQREHPLIEQGPQRPVRLHDRLTPRKVEVHHVVVVEVKS